MCGTRWAHWGRSAECLYAGRAGSVIILARDLAGCRVDEMDAAASQARHRVMRAFVNILDHPALNVLARDGAAIKKCRHTC